MKMCECGAGANRLNQYFSQGEVDFVHCTACGLVFRERFPSAAELAQIYRDAYSSEKIAIGETNQESGHFAAMSYARYIAKSLGKRSAGSNTRILDYGAGSGELVSCLRELGFAADGLEFAPDARAYSLAHRNISLLANIKDIPSGSYDLVSMIEVIEHLTALQATLQEVHRVLVPGGKLIVTTPNRSGWRARKEGGGWREAQKKFHLFLFDHASLRSHLERGGFQGVRRVRFSPTQKRGLRFWTVARVTQILGIGGTLCEIAVRGSDD